MKVLVTGGTGYIGSHTVVELQQMGYDVIIADNLSNSNIDVLDNIFKITNKRPLFEKIDLSNDKQTFDFFERHNDVIAIIHFAASKSVGESVTDPIKYYKNNLGSMLNILEGMKKHNIQHLVFSSSCTVYGQPDILPVTENAPIKKALSPYGNTKQICEEMIQDSISVGNNLNAILLRYFNPIGAHSSTYIGELPIGEPMNLMPYITQTAIGKREILKVFGSDYNTHDGTAIRDYIHVVDLAKAHIIALERMLNSKQKENVEVFNIGTGEGYSVLDVIKSFEKVSGQKLNYIIVERRAGDIEKVWADTTLANNELCWKALLNINDMALSAWNWEKSISKY